MPVDKYDAALEKAEKQGVNSLNRIERELLERLWNEHSSRGNRARKLR